MLSKTNPSVIWVTFKDLVTGQEYNVVDGVIGIAAAAEILGVSKAHMCRLLRGQSHYGPRNEKRFVYTFRSIPKNEHEAALQTASMNT